MQYRTDPKSGNQISALGLGCMRFPGFQLGHPDVKAAQRIIARAVERGVNYLDTAYIYPGSEKCVGAAVEGLGLRDKLYFATKLPHGQCKVTSDFDRLFTEQLERLRTDHIDYYLMHNITAPAQWQRLRALGIEDWITAQKAAGRIRQIGFSYHGNAVDFPVVLDAYDWDFCQIQYNYANERFQAGTAGLKAAAARGMAVFIMEPLLGGRLAGKLPGKGAQVLARADAELGRPARTPADWGLSWVWDHPQVTMLLSGMTSPEMIDQNADVAERALPGSLLPAERAAIRQVVDVFNQFNRVPCTACGYCMPCPQGIDIPSQFAAYNASYAHGMISGMMQYYVGSAVGTDKPNLASRCVRCGACAPRCPQQIAIPDRLEEVRHRLQPRIVDPVLALMAKRK